MTTAPPTGTLLTIRGLVTRFETPRGAIDAVAGADLAVDKGEILGIVGESGSGKSVTALSIMGLIPSPPGRIVAGEITLEGVGDLTRMTPRQLRGVRGRHVAMTFQDPLSFLNPVFRIGDQIIEGMLEHGIAANRAKARLRAIDLLRAVNIPMAEKRIDHYPHEFSGGMRQRALLAVALACEPRLLIADEVTTALDVVTQYEVLLLLRRLVQERGLSIIFVTHDLGVAAALCDRIAVMYAGRVMEIGPARQVLGDPRNPYTIALIETVPRFDVLSTRLRTIEGSTPSLFGPPPGCRFNPRCAMTRAICHEQAPALHAVSGDHRSACHFWQEAQRS